ncbi:MAG: adenosylhomocysteinase [Actinomycetota bacterium]|nr:adenosylhomocysteinase [Actinomycetota bacterium]
MAEGRSRIADPSLAREGERLIEWAARHSPVLNRLARDRLSDGALKGRRVAVVVHLEAKTAYLATLLGEAGAEVVVAGSNPASTKDEVCAALVERGLEVHATHDSPPEQFEEDLLAVADRAPELVVDDGAELTSRILRHRPQSADTLRGVTEETTTGVVRLRAMEAEGRLGFPAIAANDAWCKHLFDNRYGTGQSTLAAVFGLTNLAASMRRVCVVGYGWVGKGLARYAEGMGTRVTVVEVDPVKALEAHMDGYRVARLAEALPQADVVISGTGGLGVIGREALPHLKDGAVLANAGHHDREIDVPALHQAAEQAEEMRPGVTRYLLPGGRRVYLLAGGRLVNIAGADGHPVEIMDLSFSVQALAVHHLASADLPPGVHRFPEELDREIARTKLATLGIELDSLTPAQEEFLRQWQA